MSVRISEDLLQEIINHLERCIILLKDNPKIKDVGEYYTGKGLKFASVELLRELKK